MPLNPVNYGRYGLRPVLTLDLLVLILGKLLKYLVLAFFATPGQLSQLIQFQEQLVVVKN